MKKGNPYGTHRVIEPAGSLPQAAWKLDNDMEIYDNEILVEVETLNLDSASFLQIKEAAQGDDEQIAATIKDTIAKRGKQHNPVTGSGGMLIGTVAQVGSAVAKSAKEGQRIATLVSLSLTPLKITKIKAINQESGQVDIEGQAILFASGVFAPMPEDMEPKLGLAILDVAGAAPQVARMVNKGDRTLILGAGGKSGLLCLYEARKQAGPTGQVIALVHSPASKKRVEKTGLADIIISGDVTSPVEIYEKVMAVSEGNLVDVTINCVNVSGSEMTSILPTREEGMVYFFNMATSFTSAALGAEGIGRDVNMIIGNGYVKNHWQHSLALVRENDDLKEILTGML